MSDAAGRGCETRDVLSSITLCSIMVFLIWDFMGLCILGIRETFFRGWTGPFVTIVGKWLHHILCIRHLHKLKSDHRPLFLSTNPNSKSKGERPFRFSASWLSHPEFRDVVHKSWQENANILDNLGNFTKVVTDWNKMVFGYIFYRKRVVTRKLKHVQHAYEKCNSDLLREEEVEVHRELENILQQEELL